MYTLFHTKFDNFKNSMLPIGTINLVQTVSKCIQNSIVIDGGHYSGNHTILQICFGSTKLTSSKQNLVIMFLFNFWCIIQNAQEVLFKQLILVENLVRS